MPENLSSLLIIVQIVCYAVLGVLTLCVFIKIASVYARYKVSKKDPVTIAVKSNEVLSIEQEQGKVTVVCAKVENVPAETAEADAAGEEA